MSHLTKRMKTFCLLLISFAAILITSQGKPPSGFVSLFNGENLDGWWGAKTEDPDKWMSLSTDEFQKKWEASQTDIHKHWSVENGELVNDGKGLFLTTDKNYGDFELLLEYKTVAGADSGIYLRGVPQIQIWDSTKEGGKWKLGADKGSGGLWNNGPKGAPGRDPLVKADKPFGEWNKFHITMKGNLVTVILNEKLVVDEAPLINYWDRKTPIEKRKPLRDKGPIQLQTHGGEIRWRNIYVKELVPSCCDPGDEVGYVSIFNGKNLDGWKGPLSNYEVKDGAISCLKGKVWDVAVDLRKDSPTFLQYHSVILSENSFQSFLIPEGFAHGFQTLTNNSEMLYFHTADYNIDAEHALNALDPLLAIQWPKAITEQSDRDKNIIKLDKNFSGITL